MLNIFDALEKGFDRSYRDNGLVLTAMFFVLSSLSMVISASISNNTPLNMYRGVGFTLPFPNQVLIPAYFGVALLTAVVAVAAVRTFVTGDELEMDMFTDRIFMVLLNLFIGSIVFSMLVAAGLVFFVLPGIFLLVSLVYWQFFVIVEEENFIGGMRSAWQLASRNRLQIFGLLFGVFLITIAVKFAFSLPLLIGLTLTEFLFAQIGNAFAAVVGISVLAEGYNQLKE